MLTVITTLIPIFSIMLIGAWAEYTRALHPDTASIINRFVYFFAMPILLFHVMAQVNANNLLWQPIAAFLAGTITCQIIVDLGLRFCGMSAKDSTMAGLVASFPNAAFMGIPIIILLFPANIEAEIYSGIAALLPIFTIIYTDVSLSVQQQKKQNLRQTFRYALNIITHNPPLIGASLGLGISLSGISLPASITTTTQMLGATAAPCALFGIGMTLFAQIAQWSQNITPNKKQAKHWGVHSFIIGTRLFLSPLLVFAFCWIFEAKGVAATVMVIASSLPTAIITYIIADKQHAFAHGSIIAIVLSTALSCLSLPLVIYTLQNFAVL